MPDYPTGLALGLRIQGYRVRFPARAGHFWVTFWSCRGHIFIILGTCWDTFGDTLGTFSDGFGRVKEKSEMSKKLNFKKNVWEYLSCVGLPKLSIFSLLPDKNTKKTKTTNFMFFIYFL